MNSPSGAHALASALHPGCDEGILLICPPLSTPDKAEGDRKQGGHGQSDGQMTTATACARCSPSNPADKQLGGRLQETERRRARPHQRQRHITRQQAQKRPPGTPEGLDALPSIDVEAPRAEPLGLLINGKGGSVQQAHMRRQVRRPLREAAADDPDRLVAMGSFREGHDLIERARAHEACLTAVLPLGDVATKTKQRGGMGNIAPLRISRQIPSAAINGLVSVSQRRMRAATSQAVLTAPRACHTHRDAG